MNCKKRICHRPFAVTLLAGSTSVSADLAFKDGMYVGLLLGINYGSATWGGVDTLTAADNLNFTGAVLQSSAPSGEKNNSVAAGHPFFGYVQRVSSRLFVGSEIGGTFSNDFHFSQSSSSEYVVTGGVLQTPYKANITAIAETNADAVLTGAEFDWDIKGGFIFKDRALVYARTGLAANILKLYDSAGWTEYNTLFTQESPPATSVPTYANGYSSNSKNVIGLRLGLGTEYLVTERFGVLFDYVYTRYGNIETHTEGSNLGARFLPRRPDLSTRVMYGVDHPVVTISTQTFMLGVNYHI